MWFGRGRVPLRLEDRLPATSRSTADIAFLGTGTEPHRKACLMIRQSLDADSAYVDVALHGDGLTSLQFREAKGAATHEVQANVAAPRRLRIEKRGKYALMYLAPRARSRSSRARPCESRSQEPFYVGIGVCSHNKDVTEKAVFSNVELTAPLPAPSGRAGPVQHPRDADDRLDGSARGPRHAHPDRSAQLAAATASR